jgi:hypothetical protein
VWHLIDNNLRLVFCSHRYPLILRHPYRQFFSETADPETGSDVKTGKYQQTAFLSPG